MNVTEKRLGSPASHHSGISATACAAATQHSSTYHILIILHDVDQQKGYHGHFKDSNEAQNNFKDFVAEHHIMAASRNVLNNITMNDASVQPLKDSILKAAAF
jgi:hypothetical protein